MTKQPNSPQPGQQRQAGSQSGATRQQQQFDAGEGGRLAAQIHARMEVIGADGGHVGKVDRVDGDRLRLSPDDWRGSEPGSAHYLPLDQIGSIEGDRVRLTTSAERATSMATTI
jgi:hypothetical protein